jgi:uncharacterized OB-fold protein
MNSGATDNVVRLSPQSWSEDAAGVRLLAGMCLACGQMHLPAVCVCARCGHQDFVKEVVDTQGVIYSYTVNRVPQNGYVGDYAVGYIDFPDNLRVFGPIRSDGRSPRIGDTVTVEGAVLKQSVDGQIFRGFRFVTKE